MNRVIRNSMMLSLTIAVPLTLCWATLGTSQGQTLLLGVKALLIQRFGTPDQYEALVRQTGREIAVREGMLEEHLAGVSMQDALQALRKLDAFDPQMTKYVIDTIKREQIDNQVEKVALTPQ